MNPFTVRVTVRVTLRLTVYSQWFRFGVKPLETYDQRSFFNWTCGNSSYVTSSLTRRCVCLLWICTATYIVLRILDSICWMFVYTETFVVPSWSTSMETCFVASVFPRNDLHDIKLSYKLLLVFQCCLSFTLYRLNFAWISYIPHSYYASLLHFYYLYYELDFHSVKLWANT
jgi:hypothetical protein